MEFTEKVGKLLEQDNLKEQDLGSVPEHFLDPILFEIMQNPVTLPTSGAVVDLATIKGHLLSSNLDPFNRQPLKLEDVIPSKII
jgi:ubiquitin conjugation factor E4 B